MICEIICVAGFLCMSHLDIVHILSAYVHVIHTLSGHMHIMCTLFAVVLDIFLPNRQCWCHPYVISSTLYISYHVQLSFCTLSAQTHIVHVVCMLSAHVDLICLSSLTLLIFHYNLIPALCRGITRIHRLPSRPSHPYGRQPHSLIFMSTLYKATSCLPASS